MAKKSQPKAKKAASFRTPIVAVMGHVDHGKTTLLDSIRGAKVVDSEEGGITQNTRAHQITLESGNKITFIDTPGHEAFTAMRSRGAEVTDFIVLVVAADDGVKDQTKESIKFATETGTPLLVAINKVDLEGVKVDKIKRELTDFGVMIEEYGGETMAFEVSALKDKGIKELLEGIELLAEVNDIQPNTPDNKAIAQAYVLESTKNKHLGSVALSILKAGKLEKASFGMTKNQVFKTRAFLDEYQKPVKTVEESDPFWVSGLNENISTGEMIYFYSTEKEAIAAQNELEQADAEKLKKKQSAGNLLMQKLLQQKAEDEGVEQKVLKVIIRASTQGTLEAVRHELAKLEDDDSKVEILVEGTGDITESDVKLAGTTGAIVISFQQPPSNKIKSQAKQERIIMRNYEIIYEMIDELAMALDGLLTPGEEEIEVARARVKQVFTLTNGDIVAGCEVTLGTILRGYQVYVERPKLSTKDEIAEIGRGRISSLRILKDEAKEARKGQECGIMIKPQVLEIQEGDEIVAFKIEK